MIHSSSVFFVHILDELRYVQKQTCHVSKGSESVTMFYLHIYLWYIRQVKPFYGYGIAEKGSINVTGLFPSDMNWRWAAGRACYSWSVWRNWKWAIKYCHYVSQQPSERNLFGKIDRRNLLFHNMVWQGKRKKKKL